jgi:predicted HNH restriction endonuclease
MLTESYIYDKEVDWSLLHLGINVPVSLQDIFYQSIKLRLNKGEKKKIKLLIEGLEYNAVLTNIYFDKSKYPTHKDLVQIRYSSNSDIAIKLRNIFSCSYGYLSQEKEKLTNKKCQITVPSDMREHVVLYSTQFEDMFVLDCITTVEMSEVKSAVQNINEIDLERIIDSSDTTAGIIEIEKLVKVRKLNKTIGNSLKKLYLYKCQICGHFIGNKYGATVIHTHHIEMFSTSLNNSPNNIMVVCPNHHGIIHAVNPTFDRRHLAFIYPNGYVEGLKLNKHL